MSIVCLCPSCKEKFTQAQFELDECLAEEVKLEGDAADFMEELEELRLTLNSFLRRELLDSILFLYKELNKEPKSTKMYSWFARNSQYGNQCKFAILALRKFKDKRLDRVEELLSRCLDQIGKFREES